MTIPQFESDADPTAIAQAMDAAGCAVVTGLLHETVRNNIRAELTPHMERARVKQEDDPEEFYPGRTRRVTALVARSATITDQLVAHPVSKNICETSLLPNAEFGYQLHVTAALEVGPEAREQVLHREEDSFTFFPLPRPNLIVPRMCLRSTRPTQKSSNDSTNFSGNTRSCELSLSAVIP